MIGPGCSIGKVEMKASEYAKSLGCRNVKVVADACGIPVDTLYRWYHKRPDAFRLLCLGYVKEKGDE